MNRLLVTVTDFGTHVSARLDAYSKLSRLLDENKDSSDKLCDSFIQRLCEAIHNDPSVSCIERACQISQHLISSCSDRLVELAAPVVVSAVGKRMVENRLDDEDARLGLVQLISILVGRISIKINGVTDVIVAALKETNPDIVQISLSLTETACIWDPESLTEATVFCLSHRLAKIRLAAITAVDHLLRVAPWKHTYTVLAKLMCKQDPNLVHLSDFFSDIESPTRINYAAILTFDPNLSVRIRWFTAMVDWVTSLEDRDDVECHFLPYVLSGSLDDNESIRNLVESVSPKQRVKRHARKFMSALCHRIDADFANITAIHSAKLLRAVVQSLDEYVLEYIPEIFKVCVKHGHPDTSEIYQQILSAIGVHCEAHLSWPVLSVLHPDCSHVLALLGESERLDEKISLDMVQFLSAKAFTADSGFPALFSKIVDLTNHHSGDLLQIGVSAYSSELKDAVGKLLTQSSSQLKGIIKESLIDDSSAESLMRISVILADHSRTDLVGLIEDSVLKNLVVDKTLLASLRELGTNTVSICVEMLGVREIDTEQRETLLSFIHSEISKNSRSDKLSSSRLRNLTDAILTRSLTVVGLDVLSAMTQRMNAGQLRSVFRAIKSNPVHAETVESTFCIIHQILIEEPLFKPPRFDRCVKVKQPPVVSIADILNLVLPWALDLEKTKTSEVCKQVLYDCVAASPVEVINFLHAQESDGYIFRTALMRTLLYLPGFYYPIYIDSLWYVNFVGS